MSIESMLNNLAARTKPEKKEKDYIDPKDGLLHCGKCGKAKQFRVEWGGKVHTVGIVCACYEKEQEEKKDRKLYQQTQARIKQLRQDGITDRLYLKNRFEVDRFPDSRPGRMARRYVDQWDSMAAKGKGLLFFGEPGSGKTFYACCIANALIDRGVFAFITNVSTITRTWEGDEARRRLMACTSSAPLMIIDDLGAERRTEYAIEQLYAVVDQRYRSGRPLIVTTNLTKEQLAEAQEIARCRIYDRVLEMCPYYYTFENKKMRAVIAEEKKEDKPNE